LRASSNGQAWDCSASSRKFAGFSITAVDIRIPLELYRWCFKTD
jgi:hypothetical protein